LLYSFFYIGLSNTTGIKAAIITSSGSFFLVIISHYLFKNDKINIKKILGLLLGFTGVLLINLDGLIFF
jgi:drug/metabolite transporter (DMT)-like permease